MPQKDKDLKHVQKRMIEFYGLMFEECKGILKFVIKLDECDIVKEKKSERGTIMLINRALDTLIEASSKYFSVQSKYFGCKIHFFEETPQGGGICGVATKF